MSKKTLAISPCPNDTFIFEDLCRGEGMDVQFHDVQTLNELAQSAEMDVIKVSCAQALRLEENYRILAAGGAMGMGCGPLLLSSHSNEFEADSEILLPGKNTTATLLFHFWFSFRQKLKEYKFEEHSDYNSLHIQYKYFDDLYRNLQKSQEVGESIQGVVIHENRFTWQRDHLHLITDLGAFWEEQTKSPIPLGVILCRRSLGKQFAEDMESQIRISLNKALCRTNPISEFIKSHAQEMDEEVMKKHIAMFVNDFTLDIGERGWQALATLAKVQKEIL